MNKYLKYSILFSIFCCILVSPIQANPSVKKKFVSYHENGKIKEKGIYKNGEKHGNWWTYSNSGVRKSKERFKKGVRIYLIEYNEKGLKVRITNKKGVSKEVTDCGC